MADFMPKKDYDLTEITRLLLEMRNNCVPKAGDAHDDPKRAEKYEALNAAIDLINNPSMLATWISVKDRSPEDWTRVLAHVRHRHAPDDGYGDAIIKMYSERFGWDMGDKYYEVTHWMPLPEPPKEES